MTIVHWTAAELSAAIRERRVTCVEVMRAYLDHIDRINPAVNAIVAMRPRDELIAEAADKDSQPIRGWMHGFPYAVKDLAGAAGLPTSFGFVRNAPPAEADDLFVARIRAAGVIFIGKTNVPEFGLGSHTYNNVHGTTLNAYDQTRTAGGSSGGAAVAVALHMLPVADGSDFMGSLRNPPGWNNVLGLRPSFGRVPDIAGELFTTQAGVTGPIARTAEDLQLLLETMCGYDPRAPLSLEGPLINETAGTTWGRRDSTAESMMTEPLINPADGTQSEPAATTDGSTTRATTDPVGALAEPGRKVAWLGDWGGYLPMEPEVLRVTTAAVDSFAGMGIEVTALGGLPSYGRFRGTVDLWPMWLVLRHWLAGMAAKPAYDDPSMRARLKPEVVFEVEGLLDGRISAMDVYAAYEMRSDLYRAFQGLFRAFDYAVLPTAQVMPFDAGLTWPREIAGVPMSSYHRWMEVSTIGTLLNAPTLAMPAGFDRDGLPIGLQVIGRNHDDLSVIALARAWERHTGLLRRTPKLLSE